jgi:hypothetical protein
MAEPSESHRSRSNQWGIFVGAVILSLVGIGVWIIRKPAPPPVPAVTPPLSREHRNQLEEQKNVAVGLLENEQYADADDKFMKIVASYPEEILGLRNLAICRLLALEAGQMQVDQAQQAADQLLQQDANSVATCLIVSKIAKIAGNLDIAIAESKRATELAPGDAAVAYEFYQIARDSKDETFRSEARIALDHASRILPKNLFLLTEQMLAQADANNPEMITTLQGAYEKLQWLSESIRMQNRVEVRDLLDRAVVAAKDGKWPAVISNVRILGNVLRPQPATQSDRLRIQKHPLEYIVRDFSSKLGLVQTADSTDSASPIAISFQSSLLTDQNSALKNVVAVELADFDLDGRLDLVIMQDEQLRVLTRSTQQSTWEALCEPANAPSMSGMLTADLDQDLVEPRPKKETAESPPSEDPVCHDADLDFVLFGSTGVTVFRNDKDEPSGKRSLQVVPQSAKFAELRDVFVVVATDLDHDGDLDLAVSTASGISLWSNRGDMTFVDISENSQLPPKDLRATALMPVDWDRDLDFDVVCGSVSHPWGYLENTGHGRFRWQPFSDDIGSKIAAHSLSLLASDSQLTWNLLSGGPQGCSLLRTEMSRSGVVQFGNRTTVSDFPSIGLLKWDYDNDGFVDLISWSGERVQLFRGEPDWNFREASSLLSDALRVGEVRACKAGDFDRDGDLDLIVAGSDGTVLLTNQGGNVNHWLNISLRGEQEKGGQISASGRVNHYGIGSLIELRSGLNYQAQIVERAVTHFGLGQQTADVVRVLWTNGVPANIIHPRSEQQICERQTLKGSCPYVYTWSGSGFEFWTDLLWNAPMGLQFSEGIYASPRSSEYIKISGDKLQEKDSAYHLRVTEELWEAAYLDQVKLLAVDHPADVEIFSNEKVGPAELAAFKIHTVRNPHSPIAAFDQRGRNVLDLVSHADGRFLKAFDQKLRQGLAEEHFLELDLGPLKDLKQLTLFLTGWIYPTDTSINVALGQTAQLKGPRPPSIWVPTAQGEWREAVSFMGFPGGKTKTIAIDISHIFPTENYRLRIVTTAEIYWDAAFFTVNEPVAEFDVIQLPLQTAELHYRGFSQRIPNFENGPETLDYNKVERAPFWPPMDGRFTRYGDVTELLQDEDDRLVVLGSGDEVTLQFTAPREPLRAGWKRDFLMYNVGWDKDADLNTVYGQTVEPLPFGKMSGYPYRGDESYPQTPLHEEYLRRYQTRRQSVRSFWKL